MEGEAKQELFHVYKVVPKENGEFEFTMSRAHKAFVLYLAQNGGESVMDWESAEKRRTSDMEKRGETIKEHMSHLVRLGLVTETQLLLGTRVLVRLTDMGRNIASAIKGEL